MKLFTIPHHCSLCKKRKHFHYFSLFWKLSLFLIKCSLCQWPNCNAVSDSDDQICWSAILNSVCKQCLKLKIQTEKCLKLLSSVYSAIWQSLALAKVPKVEIGSSHVKKTSNRWNPLISLWPWPFSKRRRISTRGCRWTPVVASGDSHSQGWFVFK